MIWNIFTTGLLPIGHTQIPLIFTYTLSNCQFILSQNITVRPGTLTPKIHQDVSAFIFLMAIVPDLLTLPYLDYSIISTLDFKIVGDCVLCKQPFFFLLCAPIFLLTWTSCPILNGSGETGHLCLDLNLSIFILSIFSMTLAVEAFFF